MNKILPLALLLLSFKSYSQILAPVTTYPSLSVINVAPINAQFSNLKSALKQYYAKDLDLRPIATQGKIKSADFNHNFNQLKTLIPNLQFTDLAPGSPIKASVINLAFSDFYAKFQQKYHGADCQVLANQGVTQSGLYGIDADGFNQGANPIITYCQMDFEAGKGWTQFAQVNSGEQLWNAWSADINLTRTNYNERFGLRLQRFSQNATGSDLEILMKVDGQVKNLVYSGINITRAFNPTLNTVYTSQVTIQNGFYYRTANQSSASFCNTPIYAWNTEWNWSISNGDTNSCAGYNQKGGFILHGKASDTESATYVYGLNQYAGTSFSKIEFFFRKP